MGQHIRSGGIFAMPVLGRSKVSEKKCFAGTVMRPRWPLGRAFLESILQHDPKTVQMGLMNDGSGSLFRPSPRRPLYKIPAWPVLGEAHTIITYKLTSKLFRLENGTLGGLQWESFAPCPTWGNTSTSGSPRWLSFKRRGAKVKGVVHPILFNGFWGFF